MNTAVDTYARCTKPALQWWIAILAVIALSFAAKVEIARNTYGSFDAVLWETNLKELRHDGALALYRNGTVVHLAGFADHHEVFNHPPFMIRLLSWWGRLADVSGLPLRFWIRLTCALADVASAMLLTGIMLRGRAGIYPATLVLTIVSPVALMVSGFHCNWDPIMVGFLLLSIYLLEAGPIWLAGMALGLAMNIKIVPLIFLPAIFLYLSGRRRFEFLTGAIGVFLIASLPIIAQDPLLVWKQVFGYSPQSGVWGVSRFVYVFASESFFNSYARIAKIPLLCLLTLVSIWMNARDLKPPPILQCSFLAFLFLALTPGFGVQYLAWLMPFACLLPFRLSLAFHLSGGLFLFSYYNRAANGLPWYLAYSPTPAWYGSVILLGLLCWVVVCCLTIYFARRLSKIDPRPTSVADMER